MILILIFQVLLRPRILKAVVFWEIQSFPTIWMGAEKFGTLCVYCPKLYQSHFSKECGHQRGAVTTLLIPGLRCFLLSRCLD